MEKISPLSPGGDYVPSAYTRFLWWLSTAEAELLSDAVVDRNRYRIIGMTVLTTWLFATLSWSFFFYTSTASIPASVLLGLFMGFIILTIDRALIKGITRKNKRKLLPLALRGLMAITIGSFMAQPAVLYLFAKEIKLQTSLDNEKKKQLKRTELDLLYKDRIADITKQTQALQTQAQLKYADVATARNNFLAETDGSGGTGKIGIRDVALAKKKEYEKLEAEYRDMARTGKIKTDSLDKARSIIDSQVARAENEFEQYLNDGFLTRIEALSNLLKGSPALQYRYYLIIFILVLIELMPVLAKSLLPSGTYDEKASLREKMEIESATFNIEKEAQLKSFYNEKAFENDRQAITSFFETTAQQRDEKITSFSETWKDSDDATMEGLWKKMKKNILTRQEP